jgi:hypothetical protein
VKYYQLGPNSSRFIQKEDVGMQDFSQVSGRQECGRCKVSKPLTSAYFYRVRGAYKRWCKECVKEDNAERKRSAQLAKKVKRPGRGDEVEEKFIKIRVKVSQKHKDGGFEGSAVSTRNLLDIHQAQSGKCFYTGLEYHISEVGPLCMVVSRLDRERGYVEGNVVLCCWFFVAAKNKWSLEEIIPFWAHLPKISTP